MTLKEIRTASEDFGAIANRDDLKRAVPIIVAAQDRFAELGRAIKAAKAALQELSDKASKYALEHPTCFDESLLVSPIGVKSGDITIDGTVYHLKAGYGTPVREDGDCLTQGFLAELPDEWIKVRTSLDTTAINRLGVTSDELAEKGLVRPAENVWSVKTTSSTVDVFDE